MSYKYKTKTTMTEARVQKQRLLGAKFAGTNAGNNV